MLSWIKKFLLAGALTAIAAALPAAPASASDAQSDLAAVRAATDKYHVPDNAVNDGYSPFLNCFSNPALGGMGQHYVNFSLLNGGLDPLHPQAMVYQVGDGTELKLGAVEWIKPGAATDTPPQLFGRNFTYLPSLQVWVLHAWIWKPNPAGIFTNYNPAVGQCPSS